MVGGGSLALWLWESKSQGTPGERQLCFKRSKPGERKPRAAGVPAPWLEIKDRFSLGFLVFSLYFAKLPRFQCVEGTSIYRQKYC
jgi:hypothetical protein